jgi:hypothetical protein
METTVTTFQRKFRQARAAADRGETVIVKSGKVSYEFTRRSDKPKRPFAGLEHIMGITRLGRTDLNPREKIRRHIQRNRSG